MRKRSKVITLALSFLVALTTYGQTNKAVKEYLTVPGPIVLNKESFNLAWSSHPSTTYYKQEYLGAKDKIEKFKKLVMVEVLVGDAKAADLAKAKITELSELKKTNPLVNHEVFQKNGEILLDFLISENGPDGRSVNIVERNVYRYKDITDKNGKKGVLLFAASERAYGSDVNGFLTSLKKNKATLVNAVAAFNIPVISIKN